MGWVCLDVLAARYGERAVKDYAHGHWTWAAQICINGEWNVDWVPKPFKFMAPRGLSAYRVCSNQAAKFISFMESRP